MRITSRNGSRLMYQPGQAPPGMASSCGCAEAFLQEFCCRRERRALFGDARGLQVRFAAHDGGDAGGVVASGVGVVGEAGGHQQRAEVRIAQA